MKSEMADDLRVTIPQAAKLIGVSRVIAWGYAKKGLFGPVRVIDRRGRMTISAAELAKRYSIDIEEMRNLSNG